VHIDVRLGEEPDLTWLGTWLSPDDVVYFRHRLARHGDGRMLTALLADRPVGVVAVAWHAADEPEVRAHLDGVPIMFRLRVAAGFRRRGVGTALVRTGEGLLRGRDHKQVLVGVDHGNVPARSLYHKLGYQAHPDLGGLPGDNGRYDILVADLDRPGNNST
jgi:ribosomal protein S18 acetylase RimI-like enzyme